MTEGLEDGGIKVLKCSKCQTPLTEVWITRPYEGMDIELPHKPYGEPFEWPMVARCPYCNGSSERYTAKGGFMLGITEYAEWVDTDDSSGVIMIYHVKGKKHHAH